MLHPYVSVNDDRKSIHYRRNYNNGKKYNKSNVNNNGNIMINSIDI